MSVSGGDHLAEPNKHWRMVDYADRSGAGAEPAWLTLQREQALEAGVQLSDLAPYCEGYRHEFREFEQRCQCGLIRRRARAARETIWWEGE